MPPAMAAWGGSRFLGLNVSVWVAAILVIVADDSCCASPRSAAASSRSGPIRARPGSPASTSPLPDCGIHRRGLLYGIAGILLSAFIRNPTLKVGDPYLLAPIAAAVLGGTAISGGIGSMVAVAGAALFLTQLGQMLKMLGLSRRSNSSSMAIAIALGMALSGINFLQWASLATGRGSRTRTRGLEP